MSILHLEGAHQNELAATGEFNPQAPTTVLTLPSGRRIVVPTDFLLNTPAQPPRAADRDHETDLRDRAGEVALQNGRTSRTESLDPVQPLDSVQPTAEHAVGETVIPLVAEEMQVSKTQVETGRLHLRRETEEHVQTVSVPLANVGWEVEHVPVEQVVDAQPEIRQVGETIIFPLVEERMVVKRELWLREEIHVRKVTSVVEKSADFPVKRDVLVERRTEAEVRAQS